MALYKFLYNGYNNNNIKIVSCDHFLKCSVNSVVTGRCLNVFVISMDFIKMNTVLGIYEMFCNHKNFYIGKQPEPFPGTDTVSLLIMLDNTAL